jgi:hypothetical protein
VNIGFSGDGGAVISGLVASPVHIRETENATPRAAGTSVLPVVFRRLREPLGFFVQRCALMSDGF